MTEITYIALAINGFCSGLGIVAAQHFYEIYIKPKVEKMQKKKQEEIESAI